VLEGGGGEGGRERGIVRKGRGGFKES